MGRYVLAALLCLFASVAGAAGNFEFDVAAPPGLRLTITGYAADGRQTFSVTTADVQERDGRSVYVTVVDEAIIFADRPTKLCVADPSGTWDALPEGATQVCDEHPAEVRGVYTFVPAAGLPAASPTVVAVAPPPTELGCAADLLQAAGYLQLDPEIGADEAVRRAAMRFVAVQAKDPKLPSLEAATLAKWCDRFSALPETAIAELPLMLAKLNFGPDVTVAVARDTAAGLRQALSYFAATTGYELHTPPAVYVSADADWLTDAFVAATHLPAGQWQQRRDQFAACNGGEAGYGMLFMCTDSSVFAENWYGAGHAAQRAYALAHELFHVAQNELVGPQSGGCCNDEQWVARMGPVWLVEGSAEYVAFRLLSDSGRMDINKEMANQASNARKSGLSASQLESRADFYGNGLAASVGMVAVRNLVGSMGLEVLPRYWRALGHGATWQEAFHQAFGLSPQAFYAAHDRRIAEAVTPAEMVACVQGGLNHLGLSSGSIDGALGPATKSAFGKYAQKYADGTLRLDKPTDAGPACLYMARDSQLGDTARAIADRLALQATFALALDVDPAAVKSLSITDYGNNPLTETDTFSMTSHARDGKVLKQARLPFALVRDGVGACLTINTGWAIKGSDGKSYKASCDRIDPVLGTRGLLIGYTVERTSAQ